MQTINNLNVKTVLFPFFSFSLIYVFFLPYWKGYVNHHNVEWRQKESTFLSCFYIREKLLSISLLSMILTSGFLYEKLSHKKEVCTEKFNSSYMLLISVFKYLSDEKQVISVLITHL